MGGLALAKNNQQLGEAPPKKKNLVGPARDANQVLGAFLNVQFPGTGEGRHTLATILLNSKNAFASRE